MNASSSSSRRRISLFSLLVAFGGLFPVSDSSDTITPNEPLRGNETIVSSGGRFVLGAVKLGKDNFYFGIWYGNTTNWPVWIANSANPINNTGISSVILSVSLAGKLVIAVEKSTILWTSPWPVLDGLVNPVAQLLDSGNFVVRRGNVSDVFAWQSFYYPTDTMLPGMSAGVLDIKSNFTVNLTSWSSSTDPTPGSVVCWMDITGNPEFYLTAGAKRVWRTGPWDGIQFSGVPDTVTYNNYIFSFNVSDQRVAYTYTITDHKLKSRLVVNSSGVIERWVWLDLSNSWSLFWYSPKDPCDNYASCGPFGLCNSNESPMCTCILSPGFRPTSPEDWALRGWQDGCSRVTKLNCSTQSTDQFMKLSNVKLPDTTNSIVDRSLGLQACRTRCLENCNCTAYSVANVSDSSGCVIWMTDLIDMRSYPNPFGQDLFVRVAAKDYVYARQAAKSSKSTPIAVIVVLPLLAIFILVAVCFIWKWKKSRAAGLAATPSFSHEAPLNERSQHNDQLDLPTFEFETIAIATNNFSPANKLGEGGFGPVYKGQLVEGQEIAVKRLAKTSVQGIEEFKNEVMLIAKLQHRNLVRLLGCCIQREERMLVYEYMPNRSLDSFLFDKAQGVLLDWPIRYHIIEGIARGLLYLHQDSRYRIIHRDLKASNILLDNNMNPKISDFGMARIFGGDETQINTKKIVGTYGYMPPEYAMDGIFSPKSDVFSFGVLVLEIISGKRNRGVYSHSPHLNLLAHAWSLWTDDRGVELVDESLSNISPTNEILKCMKLGLLCVQEHPEDRPFMSSVLRMLVMDVASLPSPQQPGFAGRRTSNESSSSPSRLHSTFLSNTSITALEGR